MPTKANRVAKPFDRGQGYFRWIAALVVAIPAFAMHRTLATARCTGCGREDDMQPFTRFTARPG